MFAAALVAWLDARLLARVSRRLTCSPSAYGWAKLFAALIHRDVWTAAPLAAHLVGGASPRRHLGALGTCRFFLHGGAASRLLLYT